MIPTLRVSLLGDFLLVSSDTLVTTITFPRVQSFLAYLVLHRHAPQDRSRLAFLLWPDSTEAQAHTNLRKLLYQLRQAFPDIDHFLHIDKQSLQWRPASAGGSFTLDIQELEQASSLAAQAEQAQNVTTMLRLQLRSCSCARIPCTRRLTGSLCACMPYRESELRRCAPIIPVPRFWSGNWEWSQANLLRLFTHHSCARIVLLRLRYRLFDC